MYSDGGIDRMVRGFRLFFTVILLSSISAWGMDLVLPTSKDGAKSRIFVGRGLDIPGQIVKAIKDPACTQVHGTVSFASQPFLNLISACTKKVEDDGANVTLQVNKRLLQRADTRSALNKAVNAGVKIYSSSAVHDKSFVTNQKAFVTSANQSYNGKYHSQEGGFITNDSPIKKDMRVAFKKSLKYANLYDGSGTIPDTPEKKKKARRKLFASRKSTVSIGKTPRVLSSLTYNIAAIREQALKKVADSERTKRRVYVETMTGVPDGLLDAAQSGAQVSLIMDASGVNSKTKPVLRELTNYPNVKVYARKKGSPGLHHVKLLATQQGKRKRVEISSQNNAPCSGNEYNTSVISQVGLSLIEQRHRQIKHDPAYVQLSPDMTRFKKVHKRTRSDDVGKVTKKLIY